MKAVWRDLLGVLFIGDGVLASWIPQRHAVRWSRGPRWWVATMRPFVERPGITRLLGLVEVVVGLWIARRQG